MCSPFPLISRVKAPSTHNPRDSLIQMLCGTGPMKAEQRKKRATAQVHCCLLKQREDKVQAPPQLLKEENRPGKGQTQLCHLLSPHSVWDPPSILTQPRQERGRHKSPEQRLRAPGSSKFYKRPRARSIAPLFSVPQATGRELRRQFRHSITVQSTKRFSL